MNFMGTERPSQKTASKQKVDKRYFLSIIQDRECERPEEGRINKSC